MKEENGDENKIIFPRLDCWYFHVLRGDIFCRAPMFKESGGDEGQNGIFGNDMQMKQPSPYYHPCREVWLQFYKSKTNEDYYWTGKDAMHITQLVKKIQAKLTGRSMEPSVENVANSFKAFLNTVSDRWILDNLEVSIINSKFNVIYTKAVNTSPLGVRESVEEHIRKRNSERAG